MQRAHKAFTLVELLVVMSIIAILSALLLPSLSRTKESGKRARCTSNLRQLGIAGQLYWDDHEGYAFPYHNGETNGGDLWWFGWLSKGNEQSRQFDARTGALYPYLHSRGVEICPSLNYGASYFKSKAKGAAYGYGYNRLFSTAKGTINVYRLQNPSGTLFLADAAQVNTFQAPASPRNPMLEEFYFVDTNRSFPNGHFRHNKLGMVLFADSHVAPEKPVSGTFDLRLPQEKLAIYSPSIISVP